MTGWHDNLKPRASSRFQLFLAGLMWSVVGSALLAFGTLWIIDGVSRGTSAVLLVSALAVGAAKSRFILDRTARKIVIRIGERGEGRCAGGFLSLRSWLLVVSMIAGGRLLRGGLLPAAAVGTLYAAIGTGLLLSSRLAWSDFVRKGREDS